MKNKLILTKEEYRITQDGGTEAPNSGKYCSFFEAGTYLCICCGIPLFSSEEKYDSGSGWPDFTSAISEGIIKYEKNAHSKYAVKADTI